MSGYGRTFGSVNSSYHYSAPGLGTITINFATGRAFYDYPRALPMSAGYSYGGFNTTNHHSQSYKYTPPPKVDNQTKAFDRWVTERQRQGRQNEYSKQQKHEELRHSLTNPSGQEITSGLALNTILESLHSMPERLLATTPAPLDENLVKQMNFTRGTGSIGLLRKQGDIDWPALVIKVTPSEDAANVRAQVETRFKELFKKVNDGGKAEADEVKSLLKLVDKLSEIAAARASTMTFNENIDVKRFIRSLEDSISFLQQADASDWIPGKQKVKPKTVQELVKIMADKGVRFAPALVGADASYGQMHRILATLHNEAVP
jgi:hypothetical protein